MKLIFNIPTVLSSSACILLVACGEKEASPKSGTEQAQEQQLTPMLEQEEITKVLELRVGNWRSYDEGGELMEIFFGNWVQEGQSIEIRGCSADGDDEYLQTVSYDPKANVFLEKFDFANGDKMIRHGHWISEIQSLKFEFISCKFKDEPPLAEGVTWELVFKRLGPDEFESVFSERGGDEDYVSRDVVRRVSDKDPWIPYGQIVVAVKIRYKGDKHFDEATLRSKISAAPGAVFKNAIVDKDIVAMHESGNFDDVNVLAGPVDGGLELIYEVTTKPQK